MQQANQNLNPLHTKLHTYSPNAQLFQANCLIFNKKLCNKIILAQCAILVWGSTITS